MTRAPVPSVRSGAIATPLGRMRLTWADLDGAPRLCGARFDRRDQPVEPFLARHGLASAGLALVDTEVPASFRDAFARYFAGEVTALTTLAILELGTPFQRAVWRALRAIPAGETRSYGQIARAVGRARAVRAVGAANGANPIAVATPCHRVIGGDGRLTGYGGGLRRKAWLLAHESAHTATRSPSMLPSLRGLGSLDQR